MYTFRGKSVNILIGVKILKEGVFASNLQYFCDFCDFTLITILSLGTHRLESQSLAGLLVDRVESFHFTYFHSLG